jgi:hypothetical protein
VGAVPERQIEQWIEPHLKAKTAPI